MKRLKQFVKDNKKFIKTPEALFYNILGLTYKIGEINAGKDVVLKNLVALQHRNISEIKVVDLAIWN